MRRRGPKSVTALALIAMILAVASQGFAQQTLSLAELARREAERRKALKASGKVLTKQDLPETPPSTTGTATPADAAKTDATKTDAAEQTSATKAEDLKKSEVLKDEAWWRQRMMQARDELGRSEMFAEALQSRINALTSDFASRDDPYQRARIGEDRQKAMAELDRVRSEIELQKKKIGEIEEDARRASVPPGWLR